MKMTNDEYKKYADQHAPRSYAARNMLLAFLIGGTICTLGQLFIGLYTVAGLDEESAGTACSITLVFLGSLVPITGFANSVAAPALEFRTEGLVMGTAVKMFSIAGPVIVYGAAASFIYGLIYWLWTVL